MDYSEDSEHEDESSNSTDDDDLSGNLSLDLKTHMVTSKFAVADHPFFPDGMLDRLIPKHSILKILGIDKPTEEDDVLVNFIETRAKKLLAICACIKLQPLLKAMVLFQKNDFDDQKLPIKPWSSKTFSRAAKEDRKHKFVAMEGSVESNAQNAVWTGRLENIYDFQEAQWKFLAPIFRIDRDKPSQDVGTHILPFISKQVISRKGAFGDVYRCEIHKDHIKDPLRPNDKV